MYVGVTAKGFALFKFPYSETFDLVQKFRGMIGSDTPSNNPVDFMEAGLVRRDKWDMWHTDVPLAISNDETPAFTVNNGHVGANHGLTGAAKVEVPGHDKTIADVGSFWRDAEGTGWTLLEINHDCITLMSENIGPSYDDYVFKKRPVGTLTYVENGAHPAPIRTDGEIFEKIWLEPVHRYLKRDLYVEKDGKRALYAFPGEYDCAEICEEYDLVHPVAMVEAIREGRPEGGYTAKRYTAVGAPMLRISGVYRIESDGTITYHFSNTKIRDVHFQVCKGVIFQEKVDAFGGGVFRLIPKLLPIDTPEGTFDFSLPITTAPGHFPKDHKVICADWANPDSPPDRIIDYYKDENGEIQMGFAAGYLPLYDGQPHIRKEMLEFAMHIVGTRKAYPFFRSGDISSAHGVAYRKYFPASSEGSVYAVPYDGKTYIYMDFFKDTTLSFPVTGDVSLFEKSDLVTFEVRDGILLAKGKKGYAVFVTK